MTSPSKMTHPMRQTYTNRSRPTEFRQVQLGASQDGELILVQRAQKDSMEDFSVDDGSYNSFPSKSPITNLPDELLVEICRVVIADDLGRPGHFTCALALSRVSKSFHGIVQPLLFKNINLSLRHNWDRDFPNCIATSRLHRAIKANPSLGTLCRSLSFRTGFGTLKHGDYIVASEILSWLPNLTSLSLYGGFDHAQIRSLVKEAWQHMPCIASLNLNIESWSLHLASVCDIIQNVQLQSLTLGIISPPADGIVWAPNSEDLEHTSTITKLDISYFGEAREALQNLLKLPKALEHFRFRKIHPNMEVCDLSFFQCLHDHRDSLKSIEIEALGGDMGTISFLDFTNLETLNLSRWAFNISPEVARSTLLAPKLHTFIWDFTIRGWQNDSWSDFRQEHKNWIVKFAELATEEKSALRKIKIVFNPETPGEWFGPGTREELRDWVCKWDCPWDLMDEARDAIRLRGINLSYNRLWTRQECLQRMEERLRKHEATNTWAITRST